MNQVVGNLKSAVFAEEALVVDVQIFLMNLMEEKGMSRADLAKAMGVSRARVSQMLSDECRNLTVRSVARAAHALGEKVEFHPVGKKISSQVVPEMDPDGNVRSIWRASDSMDEVDVPCSSDERLQGFLASSQKRAVA